ncbi:MAG: hypothetical protein KGZ32_00615, partial [Dethiobacter sp.]|nr:hypothetical protein [Dethiobacter sp.]
DPLEVPITREAAARNLGTARLEEIKICGLSIDEVKRPFKRCAQSSILKNELPCRLYLPESACTGCRNTVIAVLVEFKEQKMLPLLSGKTIIAGRPPAAAPSGKLILVGSCTKPMRLKGAYIGGCPPENSHVVRALLKED